MPNVPKNLVGVAEADWVVEQRLINLPFEARTIDPFDLVTMATIGFRGSETGFRELHLTADRCAITDPQQNVNV